MRKLSGIQILFITISLVAVVWFLIPFILFGIMNIGNATGIFSFLGLFFYGIKLKYINNWIKKSLKRGLGRILISLFAVLIGGIMILVVLFSSLMIKAANQIPNGNETVVVLGCRVYGERASLMLMERLDAAYEYLKENEEAICILSGGQGEGEDITEAECMYRYLTKKGIEPKRLYKEEKSTSTRENLAFSKEIIEKHSLNVDIAIVTNEFHEYRATKVAEALNLNSSAVSAKTAWWLFPTYYVRELYGIIYEILL